MKKKISRRNRLKDEFDLEIKEMEQRLKKEINTAIEKHKLPNTPHVIKRIADVMLHTGVTADVAASETYITILREIEEMQKALGIQKVFIKPDDNGWGF